MPANDIPLSGSTSARSLCWSCEQDAGAGPFCKHCVKIQPIEELGDYFQLYGLKRSFNINPAILKKTFFELSRKFHPDFYSHHSKQEQTVARNNSAYLNNALKVLSDPIRRAEYLLSLVSGSYYSAPSPPQELFEEILEIGELLEKQTLSDNDRKRLVHTRDSFGRRHEEIIDSFAGLFDKLLDDDTNVKGEIEARLNNIKYLRTILSRTDTVLAQKGNNG